MDRPRPDNLAHRQDRPGEAEYLQPLFLIGGPRRRASGIRLRLQCLLCNSERDPEGERDVLLSLEDRNAAGVVLCSSRLDNPRLGAALNRQLAVVLVDQRYEPRVDHVLLDDEAGCRLSSDHLLSCSYMRIGFQAGPTASYNARRREAGYRATSAEAQVDLDLGRIQPCSTSVEGGLQAIGQLLLEQPTLTALFCYTDLVAGGALQAYASLERRVPVDLAIAGFNDDFWARLFTSALTACRALLYEIGSQAARMLLERLQGSPRSFREVVLPLELVIRESAPWLFWGLVV